MRVTLTKTEILVNPSHGLSTIDHGHKLLSNKQLIQFFLAFLLCKMYFRAYINSGLTTNKPINYKYMLISSQRQFVFIHIYKTGGTSIRKVLERYDDRYGLFHRLKTRLTPNPVLHSKTINKHSGVRHAIDYMGAEQFKQYYSFAFVRNPWDWQLSLYFQILNDPTSHHYSLVKGLKNFEHYVDWRVHDACRLQGEFLGVDGEQMISYVGRYESLNDDFQYIQKQIGVPPVSLPHLNNRQKGAYREYYTATTQQMMQEAYQKDIDAFGYTF